MLANINFIGELFKIGDMLTANIMHYCITTLLDQGSSGKADDEKIELLCKLMMSVGEKLDTKVLLPMACPSCIAVV